MSVLAGSDARPHPVAGGDQKVMGITLVDADEVEVALDVGAGEAEFAGRCDEIAQAALGLEVEDDAGVPVATGGPVVGPQLEGDLGPEHPRR